MILTIGLSGKGTTTETGEDQGLPGVGGGEGQTGRARRGFRAATPSCVLPSWEYTTVCTWQNPTERTTPRAKPNVSHGLRE